MALPIVLRAQIQKTPLTDSVMLVVWRVQVSFAMRWFAYGKVAAIPVAVRRDSGHGSVTIPVLDIQYISTAAIAVGSFIALMGLLAENRGRNDRGI